MNEITLSQRVQRVKPSPTLAVSARAAELRAAGADIIGLGVGEPDFDTPDHIKQAAIQAIKQGATRYTAVDGTPELKSAIINKFQRDNGLSYQPDQILVSCGGKHSFYNLAQALLNPGDEVIIPAPYWVSYPDMVKLADGEPVFIKAGLEQTFKITPEQLDAAITPRTRLFVINSPSNPTGVTYSREQLKGLADVLLSHPHVLIATDDMYEHIIWGKEPFANIVNVCEELFPRTIVLNGVSKAYAMTGWRLGYLIAPKQSVRTLQSQHQNFLISANNFVQLAGIAALNECEEDVGKMRAEYNKRRQHIIPRLESIGLKVQTMPAGAFYVLADARHISHDSLALSKQILEETGVAVTAGIDFGEGAEGFLRFSYANSLEKIDRAIDLLEEMFRAKDWL